MKLHLLTKGNLLKNKDLFLALKLPEVELILFMKSAMFKPLFTIREGEGWGEGGKMPTKSNRVLSHFCRTAEFSEIY